MILLIKIISSIFFHETICFDPLVYLYLFYIIFYFRSLKVIFFQDIIDILLQAEFYHPKSSKETTKIVVKARNPFQPEHLPDFTAEFSQFGNPKKVLLKKKRTRQGVIAEVEYPSQFMAYATKVAMEGSLYDCLGFISIEIVVTEIGEGFDKFVTNKFRCIMDDY